jgi:hypothetical protein
MFHLMRKTEDGRWIYIETAGSMDDACRAARACEIFYVKHGIRISHAIGAERGQAIEFFHAPVYA